MRKTILKGLVLIAVLLFCSQSTVYTKPQPSPVFGPETFIRDKGQPQIITRTFSVQDPSQPYTLLIRSGQNGDDRVTSAVIRINGTLLAGPNDFNQQTGLLIKPANLLQNNTLSIELRGKPSTSLTITIKPGIAPTLITVIDNRTDPLLLRVEYADGKTLDYFGDRDAEGLPTSIYAVRVQSAAGDVSTYFFDDQGRLIRVVAPNGVFFEFNWLPDNSIALTATAPNGDQIDVPLDPITQAVGQPIVSPARLATSISPIKQLNHFTAINAGSTIAQVINQGESTSLVTVRHCGEPVNNASVELEIRPQRGDAQQRVYKWIGNGVYRITVPNRDTGGDRILANRLCFALARTLDTFCSGVKALPPGVLIGLCPALSIGAALLGVPPPLFLIACGFVVADLDRICDISGLGEDFCEVNRVISNFISRGRLSLNVTARMPGAAFPQFATLGTPVNGVYPPVTILFPCACDAGYGKRFLINENHTFVRLTIQTFEAAFTDEIFLFHSGQVIPIGTNRQVGRVVDLGPFNEGEELVFGIRVQETGNVFRMGPGYRNPDRYVHNKVACLSDGVKVSFEDNFRLGDNDFDDAVFKLTPHH